MPRQFPTRYPTGHSRHLVAACWACTMVLAVLTASGQEVSSISFRDATEGSGIDTGIGAAGVSSFDFDDDGLDDITLARRDAPPALLRNNGDGTFTDVTADTGISTSGTMITAIWADVNRDGRPDLFLGTSGIGLNSLWLNRGDGTFEDVAEAWGIGLRRRLGAATFGDFDGDTYPDLFLGVENGLDLLYRNVSGTGFEDVSQAYGIMGEPFSIPMQATWIDVDEDGDLDLFVTHDEDVVNFLYINEGGTTFVERAAAWGIREIGAGNSMGVAWGDPDLDGDLDAYVTRIGIAGFYVFDRQLNRFYDEATPWRVAQNGVGWGTYFADLDNDGDEDLAAVHSQTAGFIPPVLFINQGSFFDPILEAGAFNYRVSDMGLAVGDFNDDALPDLIIGNTRG
ncbi:MAG: VCBS repeat-containing protein, partial [Bacteroidota bacterium]|nr:VCBS repeat-containing protein [Bacteroidota bacterium]